MVHEGSQIYLEDTPRDEELSLLAPEESGPANGMIVAWDGVRPPALQQTLGEFIREATHDLTNPLTVIRGLAQHLEKPEPAAVRDHLGIIETTADRMVSIINRLVQTEGLGSPRLLQPDRHPSGLVALAQHAVAQCRHGSDAHLPNSQRASTSNG